MADTYNNTVIKAHLHGMFETIAQADSLDLYEPGGLAFYKNTLFIADTSRHRICSLNLDSGKTEIVKIVVDSRLQAPPYEDSP